MEVICTSLLVLSSVARVSRLYKSGAYEWRWLTQAQLTRREFIETSMSWAGTDTGRLYRYLGEEGELAYPCLWFHCWSVS